MTSDDVRAAAARLTRFHPGFAPLLGKDAATDHASVSGKGHILGSPRLHADIRMTEFDFIREEEDAEVPARRLQIRVTGSRNQ
jgi:hypothetical protein